MKKSLLLLLAMLVLLPACHKEQTRLKVAASSVPHADLLEYIESDLRDRGITLQIIEIDDYHTPNRLLAEKQVDANFFQHDLFLQEQITRFGYPIVSLTRVHIEPLGIYSRKISLLTELPEGGTVALPSDPTNEARALHLLASQGLITLGDSHDLCITVQGIQENPKNLRFREIDAPMLPRTLSDVDIAVIPANFALQADLYPQRDALLLESDDSPYANILAIREEDLNREDLQTLATLLTSSKLRTHIKEKYQGAIEPAF